jgi:hypothetical protein
MRNVSGNYFFYILIAIFVFGFFKISVLGGWDQSFYWAQLTSIWYDGDLTLHDDLLANRNPLRDQYRTITFINQQGMLPNTFSIGTALVDGVYAGPIVFIHRLLGLPRMSSFLLSVVGIATIFKIWLLLLSVERLLNIYSPDASIKYAAIGSAFLGTPLLFYALIDYGMSHLNSSLFAALFVLALIGWLHQPDMFHSTTLGVVAGILILIRWQDGIYAFLVIPPLLYQFFHVSRNERWRYLKGSGIGVFITLIMVSLQSAAWYKQFRVLLHIPQGSEYVQWASPQWVPLLFSGYHGLFIWSPVVVIAIIGLVRASVGNRGLWRWFMVGSLLTIAATVYVNACVLDWWGGWSYGTRRVCSLVPLFALGTFDFMKSLNKKIAVILLILVGLWAYFTFTCYQNRIDDLSVPILGKQSHFSPANDRYWITNAEEARSILMTHLPSPHYSAVKLFSFKKMKFINRVLSAVSILGTFVLANMLFTLWRRQGRCRKTLLALTIVYAVTLTLIIAIAFPDSYRLNLTWKQYLERTITPDEAITQGVPEEPVRFIEALSFVSRGEPHKAQKVLTSINTADYRNLRFDKILEFLDEKARSGLK